MNMNEPVFGKLLNCGLFELMDINFITLFVGTETEKDEYMHNLRTQQIDIICSRLDKS